MSDLAIKRAGRIYQKRLYRWLLLILVIWLIPAFFFSFGVFVVVEAAWEASVRKAIRQLETSLVDVANDCRPEVFFQNQLNWFFEEIKGIPARQATLDRVLRDFTAGWPDGMIDIFIFDGDLKLSYPQNAPEELEMVLKLIKTPWTDTKVLKDEFELSGGLNLPSPRTLVESLRGRPKQVILLGGLQRYSWGYYRTIEGGQSARVATILAFMHRNRLPANLVFENAVKESGRNSAGYIMNDGSGSLPAVLSGVSGNSLRSLFPLFSNNVHRLGNRLVVARRFDDDVLLVAASAVPTENFVILGVGALVYLLASFLVLVLSFRIVVLRKSYWIGLRTKVFGLFALSFAFPVMSSAVMTLLYVSDRWEVFLEEYKTAQFQRLADLDSGFQKFVMSRQTFFKGLTRQLQAVSPDTKELLARANDLHEKGLVDNLHIVSSQSQLILSQTIVSSEVRRGFNLPLDTRLAYLESWIERGARLGVGEIKRIVEGGAGESDFEMQKLHGVLMKLIQRAGVIAVQEWNRRAGVSKEPSRSSADLMIDAIVEKETAGFLQSIKSAIGEFFRLHGSNEYAVVFVDVLQNSSGEADYAIIVYNNLITLQRQYLEGIYQRTRYPDVFLCMVEGEDIRALNKHYLAPNFPGIFDYRKFDWVITAGESQLRPIAIEKELDGIDSMVYSIRCSSMNGYHLVSIVSRNSIEEKFRPLIIFVAQCYLVVLLLGVTLGYVVVSRFVNPVRSLAKGMDAINSRDFKFRLQESSTDEFGLLAGAFNRAIERLEETQVAVSIQRQILPKKAVLVGNYSIMGENHPARLVGGDYFDFIPLRQGLTAIVLADVSGHGVSAAIVTAMAKAAYSILCPKHPEDPCLVVTKVNAALFTQLRRSKMMTAFLGILDSTNDVLICVNAGQCYPMSVFRDGSYRLERLPSFPLGVRSEIRPERVDLDIKDRTIVLYSDGVVEALDGENAQYGFDRFCRSVADSLKTSPKAPIDPVLRSLREFSGGVQWKDDVTIVFLKASAS